MADVKVTIASLGEAIFFPPTRELNIAFLEILRNV